MEAEKGEEKEAEMIDGKQLGAVGFRKLGTPYSEMDCQAFVEWCLKQCGLDKNLAGSNAWFREVRSHGEVMTPEECVRELGTVPPGAFLFIVEHDGGEPAKYKPDGLGNASHIGIVTGKGEGAIHSSASRGCVAESKFQNRTISGGWNMVGLYDQVVFDFTVGGGMDPGGDPEPAPAPAPTPAPVKEYATVWSENDLPVNTRKGPGRNYTQSMAGKIPVGETVEILKRTTNNGEEWCQIRVQDKHGATWTCWMMGKFLAADAGPVMDPEDSFQENPEPVENPEEPDAENNADSGDDVIITLQMTRPEAELLLRVVDNLCWKLVQVTGGRG